MLKQLLNNRKKVLLPIMVVTIFLSALLCMTEKTSAQPALDSLGSFWQITPAPGIKDIRAMAVDSSGYLYMSVWGDGIQRSTNNGTSWTDITNNLGCKYINTIQIDSIGRIYLGTMGGGVYESVNNGNSWSPYLNGLTNLRVTALIVRGNGTAVAGTNGGGIYLTTNGGQKWTQLNKGLRHWDVTALHFTLNGAIIAATPGSGIFRSTDMCQTWKPANGSLSNKNVTCFSANAFGDIVCGTMGGGVNISVDDGGSWQEYEPNDKVKNVTSCVYVSATSMVAGLEDKGYFRYDDLIYLDWVMTSIRFGSTSVMFRNTNGDVYAAMPYYGIYKSTDNGKTWSNIGFQQTTNPSYAVKAGRNGVVMAKNQSGGIIRSLDNGLSWATSGLSGQEVVSMAVDSSGYFLAGTKSLSSPWIGGLYRTTDNGVNWTLIWSKTDSIPVAIGINPSGHVFTGLSFPPANPKDPKSIKSELFLTTDGGLTWVHRAATAYSAGFAFIGFNGNGDLYYNSDSGLVKSNNGGVSRTIVSVSNASSIGFTSTFHIFAGIPNGVIKSVNNGTSWTKYGFPPDSLPVSCLIVTKMDQVFAFQSGSGGIMYTADEGTTWKPINHGSTVYTMKDATQGSDGFILFSSNNIFRGAEPNSLVPPTTVSPKQMEEGIALNGPFKWNKANNAIMYEFQLSGDAGFLNINERFTIQDTNWSSYYQLSTYTFYYYRLRTRVNNSFSDWTQPQQFSTIVSSPTLLLPDSNSVSNQITNLKLVWQKLPGAGGYNVNVSTDPKFGSLVVNKVASDTFLVVSGLNLYTKYYWRVNGISNKSTGPWSNVWPFTTKLKPVVLKAPANTSYGWLAITKLEWYETTGATKYEVQIAKDPQFQIMAYEGLTEANKYHNTKILELFTTYYWRIRGFDDTGYSDWCDPWSFTTVIDVANLISPDNLAEDLKTTQKFEWKNYDKATAYHLQVAKDDQFKNLVYNENTIKATTVDVPSLEYFTRYFWRVRNMANQYSGLWSEVRSFTTGISFVTLVSPLNNAINQSKDMLFTWNTVDGADIYTFQLATDVNFVNMVKQQDVADTRISVPDLEFSKTYFFRVKAKYSKGEGDWSETRTFTTQDGTGVNDAITGLINPQVFPNPADNLVTVTCFIPSVSTITGNITDNTGRLVMNNIVAGGQYDGNVKFDIDTKELIPGTYFINLNINNSNHSLKLVIVR